MNEQTKATNILQVPLKQSAVILDIDKSKIDLDSVLPLCQILIQLKSETANMIIDRKPLNHTVETLSTFLKTVEISYAYEFNDAAPDDKSILDGGVKGFEHISFDWVLGLRKYLFSKDITIPTVGKNLNFSSFFSHLLSTFDDARSTRNHHQSMEWNNSK